MNVMSLENRDLPEGAVPLADWEAEGERRFGERRRNWAFVCPRCGRVSTALEVHEAGGHKESAVRNCIGRYDSERGCDWAAYGLFGNLGRGPTIAMPDGTGMQVFAFAHAGQESGR